MARVFEMLDDLERGDGGKTLRCDRRAMAIEIGLEKVDFLRPEAGGTAIEHGDMKSLARQAPRPASRPAAKIEYFGSRARVASENVGGRRVEPRYRALFEIFDRAI